MMHPFLRTFAIIAVSLTASVVTADDTRKPKLPNGIVDVQPKHGRSVKLDDGTWMISYRETIADGLSFEMVPVPGGKITIGSPETEAGRRDDEGPQFEVEVDPYWIGATEVSWDEYSMYQATYRQFRQQSTKEPKASIKSHVDAVTAPTPIYDEDYVKQFGGAAHPAVTMTQYGAMQYSKWLWLTTGNQYRLPTEVEWENSCRAGSSTAYSFGDDTEALSEYAQFHEADDGDEMGPLPVGSKRPNAFGLHDMHGNVAEWVIDQYAADAYKQLASRIQASRPVAIFGDEVYNHIIRGGGWMDSPELLRSAARRASSLDLMAYDSDRPRSPHWFASDEALNIGFRVARSSLPESDEVIVRFWNPNSSELTLDIEDRLSQGRGAIGIPAKRSAQSPSANGNPAEDGSE